MIDSMTLNNILGQLNEDKPIRIWAYDQMDKRVEKYIEGFGNTSIYERLDSLPGGSNNYDYVIKIGMGN